MACINPDGSLTTSAKKVLESVKIPKTILELAEATNLPRYRIRASLRELSAEGLVSENGGDYTITDDGEKQLIENIEG
ncbi:hypothetical protein ACFLUC_03275 [Chloroflexota bacterium]